MMERLDHPNIEQLIVSTVSMLCKNSILYSSELHIQGTIGITVDASSVVLVHLNQRFEYGAEDSHRSASAHKERGAGESIQATTYSLADAKLPRMTSVTHCSRRPVGRGRVSVRPAARVRSGQVVRARHQLAFPGSSKVALTKPRGGLAHPPVQHLTLSSCTSRQIPAGHVASSIMSSNETPQQLPAKLEVESGQSGVEMTQLPMSSDVICVESDDETESDVPVRPGTATSRLNDVSVKSEGQSLDALQMIVDRAVVAARASNPGMTESTSCNMIIATASQQSTPSLSDVYLGSVNMHYSDENMAQTDIKPTVESGVQQWTPSKRLMMSPSKTLLSSPTGIKTEVSAHSSVFGSAPLHPSCTSKAHSSAGGISPAAATRKGASQQNPASWTAVTETTFICTTAGCSKRFTTKRALVRHQKDKHGLVTRHMLTAGGKVETDSDSASGTSLQ